MRKFNLFLVLIFIATQTIGQTTIFSENIGTPSANTLINNYSGWENSSPISFSSTSSTQTDVRTSTASTGYTGASGSGNVFITNVLDRNFLISGINTTGYENLQLSLGHYKSTTAGNNELKIEVSSDGTNFTELTYTRATGTGTANWILVSPSGTIPSTSNLTIKFTQTSTTTQFRIDDIKITGTEINSGGAPSVSSATVSTITTSSATLGGTIINDGGNVIIERGVVWSVSNTDPLIGGTGVTKIAEGGTAVSAFTTSAGSLPSGTLIYYKAYATNSQGTGYTSVSNFSTLSEEPTNHVTNFACSTTQSSSIPLSWTDAIGSTTPAGYLIKWSSVSFADISDPVDGVAESNGTGRLNVAAGVQAVDINGLAQVTTYYFKIFPYTNAGSTIDFKTDGVVPSTSCITLSGPWEDFETGTKTGYAVGSVTCSAGSWTMDDALLGTSASDAKNGTKSVRIRNGSLTMDFDVTTGIGILRLYHAKYGTDVDGTWQLEASTDGGTTWTAYVSSPITSSSTTLTQQSFNLNLPGNVRVRVVKTDGGSNRINIDDITFTLPAPLPVKFTNVRAYQQGNGIKVEWSNQTETDVMSYHVERSATGQGFTSLTDISASKNDGSRADYAFYDALPVNGTNFYRIHSVETDGKKLYSAVVRVNTKGGKTEISLYPNPVTAGQLSMQATDLKQGLYTLHIFNAAGQQVYTQQLIHAGGAVTETVQLPASLKSGLYSLQVRNAEVNLSKLFIIR